MALMVARDKQTLTIWGVGRFLGDCMILILFRVIYHLQIHVPRFPALEPENIYRGLGSEVKDIPSPFRQLFGECQSFP